MKILSTQAGFTLIELMITVSIVGILAVFATINFQNYVMKSQLSSIYSEVNGYRVPYQMLMGQGAGVGDFTPQGLNMYTQTRYCQFTVTAPVINGNTIDAVRCDIHNIPLLSGQHLSLNRTQDGDWLCVPSSGISQEFLPEPCR